MKKIKAPKTAHTSNSKIGMGDFYGSGVRNKMGRMRSESVSMVPVSKKKLGKPPKSLA